MIGTSPRQNSSAHFLLLSLANNYSCILVKFQEPYLESESDEEGKRAVLKSLLNQTPLWQRHLPVRWLQQNLHDALGVRGRQGRQLQQRVPHLVLQPLQDAVLVGQGGHDHLEERLLWGGWLVAWRWVGGHVIPTIGVGIAGGKFEVVSCLGAPDTLLGTVVG